MKTPAYDNLCELVRLERYYDAELLCRQMSTLGADEKFWKTQMGYVYFLNGKNDRSYYDLAPDVFKSLVYDYPTDINSHFLVRIHF